MVFNQYGKSSTPILDIKTTKISHSFISVLTFFSISLRIHLSLILIHNQTFPDLPKKTLFSLFRMEGEDKSLCALIFLFCVCFFFEEEEVTFSKQVLVTSPYLFLARNTATIVMVQVFNDQFSLVIAHGDASIIRR